MSTIQLHLRRAVITPARMHSAMVPARMPTPISRAWKSQLERTPAEELYNYGRTNLRAAEARTRERESLKRLEEKKLEYLLSHFRTNTEPEKKLEYLLCHFLARTKLESKSFDFDSIPSTKSEVETGNGQGIMKLLGVVQNILHFKDQAEVEGTPETKSFPMIKNVYEINKKIKDNKFPYLPDWLQNVFTVNTKEFDLKGGEMIIFGVGDGRLLGVKETLSAARNLSDRPQQLTIVTDQELILRDAREGKAMVLCEGPTAWRQKRHFAAKAKKD